MSTETTLNNVEIITNNITNTSTSSTTTQQHDDLARVSKQQLVAESSPAGAKAKLKEITSKDNKQSKGKSSISKAMNGSSDFGTGILTSENLMSEADEVIESYKEYTTKLEGLVHMLHVRVDQLEIDLEDSHKKITELTKRNTTPVDTHANAHTHSEVKDDSKSKAKKSKGKEHTDPNPPAHSTLPEKHETPTPDKHETPLENANSKPSENKHDEKKSEEKKSEKAENNKKQKRNPKATTNVDEGN